MIQLAARGFLKLMRWEPEGARPVERRFVLIAAPHTSNWDLAFLLALSVVFGLEISWMGKDALFRRCLALVLPSRYEGFGMPYVESLLAGVNSPRRRTPRSTPISRTYARTARYSWCGMRMMSGMSGRISMIAISTASTDSTE